MRRTVAAAVVENEDVTTTANESVTFENVGSTPVLRPGWVPGRMRAPSDGFALASAPATD